jgi:hypothetical protein
MEWSGQRVDWPETLVGWPRQQAQVWDCRRRAWGKRATAAVPRTGAFWQGEPGRPAPAPAQVCPIEPPGSPGGWLLPGTKEPGLSQRPPGALHPWALHRRALHPWALHPWALARDFGWPTFAPGWTSARWSCRGPRQAAALRQRPERRQTEACWCPAWPERCPRAGHHSERFSRRPNLRPPGQRWAAWVVERRPLPREHSSWPRQAAIRYGLKRAGTRTKEPAGDRSPGRPSLPHE